MKIYASFLLIYISIVTSGFCQDHCNPNIHHSVKKENGSSSYTIFLKSSEITRIVSLELYDLFKGEVVQKKETINGLTQQLEPIFYNVKPSLYIIYMRQEDCNKIKSIGGIEGIRVGTDKEN